jgi:hypothetical protein
MDMKNDVRQHYAARAARALIGKPFESLIEFSGVPQGTRGKVVGAGDVGLGHWDVVIEWDLPGHTKPNGQGLRDWFAQDEMARFMREVTC